MEGILWIDTTFAISYSETLNLQGNMYIVYIVLYIFSKITIYYDFNLTKAYMKFLPVLHQSCMNAISFSKV